MKGTSMGKKNKKKKKKRRKQARQAAREASERNVAPDPEVIAATLERQRKITEKLGIGAMERHVFVCCDPSKAKCCSRKRGVRAYAHLKQRLKDEGLLRSGGVYLSRANCLDVCKGGPILVVHPDGTWYGHADPAVIDRIVDEHLKEGRPVEDYRIAHKPLPAPAGEG